MPTDPEYLQEGPITMPVDLEFNMKTLMIRKGGQTNFQSKIVVIKLNQTDEETGIKTTIADAQLDLAQHLGDSEEPAELNLPFTKMNGMIAHCSISVKKIPKAP